MGSHYAGYAKPTDPDCLDDYVKGKAQVPCSVCGTNRADIAFCVVEKERTVFVCNTPSCIGNGYLEATNTPQGRLVSATAEEIWQPAKAPLWTKATPFVRRLDNMVDRISFQNRVRKDLDAFKQAVEAD